MHIPMVSPNIPKGKWIKWAPPHVGILKLNTDGSSGIGMGAGGGIIRDHNGSALFAFSTFYGPGTNTFAEAKAPLFSHGQSSPFFHVMHKPDINTKNLFF
nr:ribonuclease H domain [Tanacetum cinerariifolium]